MSNQILRKSLGAPTLILAFIESGCLSTGLTPNVVKFDLAVETTQNEMLLLNAVRASKRKPMYLIDISKLTGSITEVVTGNLTLPFGQVHGNSGNTGAAFNTSTVGATLTLNPTFEVNILNNQEFMTGFLQPVTLGQIAYYLDQGFPAELLLHLFVLQVDVGGKTYRNHPRSEPSEENTELKEFGQWVTDFAFHKPQWVACEPKQKDIGPPLSHDQAANLKSLVATATENLSLEETPNLGAPQSQQYQLKRVEKQGSGMIVPKDRDASLLLPCEVAKAYRNPEVPAEAHLRGLDWHNENVTFHLRSPESVLYYLGQIIRMETSRKELLQLLIYKDYGEEKEKGYQVWPLFVALRTNSANAKTSSFPQCKEAGVKVTDEEHDTYVIPESSLPPPLRDTMSSNRLEDHIAKQKPGCPEPGMSYDVLTILNQLIALHKSAKDFPSTPLVRAIGP